MKRNNIKVAFAYEYGDKSLPPIKELVSDNQDSEKRKILDYLQENCVLTCPGIVTDIINPDKSIGYGNVFSDGVYYWTDVFINYVDRYNIPVPEKFRNHILSNYEVRRKRHMLLRMVNCLEICNNAAYDKRFIVRIHRNGLVEYRDILHGTDDVIMQIDSDIAGYIIDPISTELFCYDSDNHGTPLIDGYHWRLTFSQNNKVIDIIEGTNGEDKWRYDKFKKIVEFAERFIPQDIGSAYMKAEE